MTHVFETQPPVHTDGHAPVQTGSAGQFTQRPAAHVVPAVQAYVVPQPPQSLLSVCSFTQAPSQGLKPLLHA
jgi:hypothetical protein